MNIKSLLLGSAAAAVAFTGAQAADAIVIAEPEPLEYVRICDAYGAGYFYIPGTETCLRISGWARYQIDTVDRGFSWTRTDAGGALLDFDAGNANISLTSGTVTAKDEGWRKTAGAQVNLDARSETEYGTLRGWVQLEGTRTDTVHVTGDPINTDINISINRAVIQLGGLWLAYADSLFSSSNQVAGGSGLGNYGGFTYADTFNYHYEQRNQIGYQFSGGNGFWGAISLEHDDAADYMPDVVGKVAFSQGWGGVWLAAGYDESAEGVGVRGGIQGNFAPLTVRLDGYYQSNALVSYGRGARWAIQGTALYQVNEKLGVAVGLEYRDRLVADGTVINLIDAGAGAPAGRAFYDGNAWAAQLGVNWQPVQNFLIGADVTYNKEKVSYTNAANETFRANQDNTRFRLRFQRNF